MPEPTANTQPDSPPITLTIAHSPDPDDVYMWWPLGDASKGIAPEIDTGPFRFVPVPEDIQALNERAMEKADLDITALSMHAAAHVADRYAITTCGSSMGDDYGPRIVTKEQIHSAKAQSWLCEKGRTIAVPGLHTSAWLTLQMMLDQPPTPMPMRFDLIPDAVRAGDADAGLVIHQSQITYREEEMHLLADLGSWWAAFTKEASGAALPLPLGANAVKLDLDERFGPGTIAKLCAVLDASIAHAMEHPERGLDVAAIYEPDLPRETAKRFIDMYVNDLTVDMGGRGTQAVTTFMGAASSRGLIPTLGAITIASAAGPAQHALTPPKHPA